MLLQCQGCLTKTSVLHEKETMRGNKMAAKKMDTYNVQKYKKIKSDLEISCDNKKKGQ